MLIFNTEGFCSDKNYVSNDQDNINCLVSFYTKVKESEISMLDIDEVVDQNSPTKNDTFVLFQIWCSIEKSLKDS